MLKGRVFLVISNDFINRKRAIDNIKAKLLGNKISFLNTHTYFSREIDLERLKDLLFSFSFEGNRIVIFKEAERLGGRVKDFIYSNIKHIIDSNYLIFELEEDYSSLKGDKRFIKDRLFGYLLKKASLFKLSSFREDISINKLMSTIRRDKLNETLYLLEMIFEKVRKKREFLGIQILGALTKEFSYLKNPLRKEKCFKLVWETERIIKEGRLDSKIALQFLMVRLFL